MKETKTSLTTASEEEPKTKPICFIPARKGSKRLPDKHKLPINSKPVVLYTIEAAQKSELFDPIVVTSDDEDVLEIAYEAKCRVHQRHRELAVNSVQLRQVMKAMFQTFSVGNCVCMMPPDNPFVTAEDLKAGYELFRNKQANYVMSVVKSKIPKERLIPLKGGYLEPQLNLKRAQDAKPTYYHDSSFIFFNPKIFIAEWNFGFYGTKCVPYVVPHISVDIDTLEDYEYAKYLMEVRNV